MRISPSRKTEKAGRLPCGGGRRENPRLLELICAVEVQTRHHEAQQQGEEIDGTARDDGEQCAQQGKAERHEAADEAGIDLFRLVTVLNAEDARRELQRGRGQQQDAGEHEQADKHMAAEVGRRRGERAHTDDGEKAGQQPGGSANDHEDPENFEHLIFLLHE